MDVESEKKTGGLRSNSLVQAWLVLAVGFGVSLAVVQLALGPVIEQNKINETLEKLPELVLGRVLADNLMAAVTMSAAVGFVLLCANVITSLIRNLLKPHLRIVVFTLTIATFVTIADRFLAAYLYQMSKTLGLYIPLIIICRCDVVGAENPADRWDLGRALALAVFGGVGFTGVDSGIREAMTFKPAVVEKKTCMSAPVAPATLSQTMGTGIQPVYSTMQRPAIAVREELCLG